MNARCAARFLLPTPAHLASVRAALARSPRCTVAIRRAFQAPSPANPFDWEFRARELAAALGEAESARVEFVPQRECYEEVDSMELDGPVVDWLHGLYLADDPAALLRENRLALPASTVLALQAWTGGESFDTVRADWRQIAREQAAWSVAPYPVVLVTVDAVVRAGGCVLLIRRGRSPGKGLWAIPGGFLETTEPVLDAALRELMEETGLAPGQARQALRGVRVFDHPQRSQRGRVITHCYFFDLGEGAPPPVQGSDDAAAAEWVPIERLPQLETRMHDDHFHILTALLPPPPGEGWGGGEMSHRA